MSECNPSVDGARDPAGGARPAADDIRSAVSAPGLPLRGVRVLDLSSLLPGPLASMFLAEAGASVVKIERPGLGDPLRAFSPQIDGTSVLYALLNKGKRIYSADLKDPTQRDQVKELARSADVVIEQFRPGVASRLGIDYQQVRAGNPMVVYCSISGYGQLGPYADRAGFDLNYVSDSGLLGATSGLAHGIVPPTSLADIAGGTYPALVNILLALFGRDRVGSGAYLDISMTAGLQPLAYRHFAERIGTGRWPEVGTESLSGGSPRYNVYEASDHRYVALAAMSDAAWLHVLTMLGLDVGGRGDMVDAQVAERFRQRPASEWAGLFDGGPAFLSVVNSFAEAEDAGHFATASSDRVVAGATTIPGLPSIVADTLRAQLATHVLAEPTPLPSELTGAWPSQPKAATNMVV